MNLDHNILLILGGGLLAMILKFLWGERPRKGVTRNPVIPRPLPPDVPVGVNHDREKADDAVLDDIAGRPHSDDALSDLQDRLDRHRPDDPGDGAA